MAYRDVVLADSPADFYEMESSAGTDSGSGGRTLTVDGGVTTDVTTPWGKGWSFDGVNDSASTSSFPTVSTAFTFEAWVKPNLAGVNDTPSIIRRDGTDIHLLRVRGSASSNPGQAEVYADGLVLLSTSSYRVDDGNWHHLVYTQSGNTAKLYVDGQQRASGTTSQSSFNLGTGSMYIGTTNIGGEYFKGLMDNVAIYTTALSAARVLAHYEAGTAGGYVAQPMTASAMAGDARGFMQNPGIIGDTYVWTGDPNTANGGSNVLSLSTEHTILLSHDPIVIGGGPGTSVKKTLTLTRTTNTPALTLSIYSMNSSWIEGVVTVNNMPAKTFVRSMTIPAGNAGTSVSIDLTGVTDTFGYAFVGSNTSVVSFASKGHATVGYRPAVSATVELSDATISAAPAAGSALMTDAPFRFTRTYFAYPVEDFLVQSNGTQTNNEPMGIHEYRKGVFLFDELPDEIVSEGIVSAQFAYNVASGFGGSVTYEIRQLSGTSANYWTATSTLLGSATGSLGINTIDVNITKPFSGFVILTNQGAGSVGINVSTISASNPLNRPQLTVEYEIIINNADVSASPAVASATLTEGQWSQTGVGSAQVLAASATMTDSTVTAEQFVSVNNEAEAMTGLAEWPTATGFSVAIEVNSGALVADAGAPTATVTTEKSPASQASPMLASAMQTRPLVNGNPIVQSEIDDRYFQRLFAVPPKVWYRFSGDTGGIATNRMANPPGRYDGSYDGVITPGFNGPDGRQSIGFVGTGRISQNEAGADEVSPPNNSIEFSFRTTKSNTILVAGSDLRAGTQSNTLMGAREVWLRDGKISQRTYTPGNPLDPNYTGNYLTNFVEFTGFRNLADGNWHHVVIRSVDVNTDLSPGAQNIDGVEVYIDGTFEVRRAATSHIWTGFPDFIGSRPEIINSYRLPPLSSSLNFVGDFSEVAFFERALTPYEISRHYYDFMGWNPVEAGSADAFAFTPAEHRGRGNQKRALYLWWTPEFDSIGQGGTPASNRLNFDPVLSAHGNTGVYDLEGYKVFSRPVLPAIATRMGHGLNYTDSATDRPTLIDLFRDVDIDDYDVVMFGDWPTDGADFDKIGLYVPDFQNKYERLLSQLRDANDRGIGLLVTIPRLAIDLGIIDRVENIPTLRESSLGQSGSVNQGNAAGLYDYGSAVKFPWNVAEDAGLARGTRLGAIGTGDPQNLDPNYLARKAFFYYDTNRNNKFRVRALIDGLTNIPAFTMKDVVYHVDLDTWGDDFAAMNLEDRMDGLQIGDEFVFHGTLPAEMVFNTGGIGHDVGRRHYTVAVPLGNVRAGTVVTTFGAKHWQGRSEVDNPYKDYATTIALDVGDTLAGRSVGGRIFVSFTEQPNIFSDTVRADILPGSAWDDGSATWPNTYPPDTLDQRDWENSGTRVAVTNQSVNGRVVETVVALPDGTTYTTRDSTGDGFISATYRSLFAQVKLPYWDMTRRGMWWIGRSEKPKPGEVRVGGEAMVASAGAVTPTVTAQRDGGFTARPMLALAQATRVAEDVSGDADVATMAMTANATFTGFGRVVQAAPMTAGAALAENFNMVHATGEQVVLTLHGVDETLFLKEESA